MEYITNSPAETENLGKEFANRLKRGDFVAMFGDLGVGKTAFIRGVASVLCPGVRVQSPTYTIVNAYGGNIPVYHFDMYRINGFDNLYSTGFFDYLDAGGVLVIEWSENVLEFLPKDMIRVDIKRISDNEREITVKRGEEE